MADVMDSPEGAISCAGVNALAFEYLDRELPAARQDAVEQHVGRCPPCREYLERERTFLRSLRTCMEGEKCPDVVRERVREAMRLRRESQQSS